MKTKPFPLALVWLRAIWYFNSPHSSLHLPSLCRQWVLPCNLPVVCICAWYAWVVPVPVPVLNKRFWSLFTTQYTKHAWGMQKGMEKSSTAFYKRRTYIAAPNCPTSTQSSRHYRDISASYFQHLCRAFFKNESCFQVVDCFQKMIITYIHIYYSE